MYGICVEFVSPENDPGDEGTCPLVRSLDIEFVRSILVDAKDLCDGRICLIGKKLTEPEIYEIIQDILDGNV